MNPAYINSKSILSFIKTALKEDVGDGDHSTLSIVDENHESSAQLLVKQDGVIAGLDLAQKIFLHLDQSCTITFHKKDGEEVKTGEIAFIIQGKTRALLTGERLVLNCMQRMSGIATKTNKIVKLLSGTHSQLLDTRKTTPNFRMLEKWAVHIGGGKNHRFGLFDMIMLKDNHVDLAGGVEEAIRRAQNYIQTNQLDLKIEVETRNIDEVKQVVKTGGVDFIMLDNMIPSLMREAIQIIGGRYKTEASGGITELNIKEVATSGIDFISVGALTHSYESLDMSLKTIK